MLVDEVQVQGWVTVHNELRYHAEEFQAKIMTRALLCSYSKHAKQALMDGRSRPIAVPVPDPSARWVISATPWPLYPWERDQASLV